MTISGFTFVKNAEKYYYPIKESIMSILPIVDEFIVALGNCDEDDKTPQLLQSINNPKVKIINTVWDIEKYYKGMENAHQTDIAKSHCSGDWLFYLQGDEVIHEKYLPVIVKRCDELYNDTDVEGMIFGYKHFWGDYSHYVNSHGWYKFEIRIIRNRPEIHSWESAQSFRKIYNFDGINYRQKKNTYRLKVAKVDAEIYHYGWVRPPQLMVEKNKALATIHKGKDLVNKMDKQGLFNFDYGRLDKLPIFNDTHPAVMKERIERFNWHDQLQFLGKRNQRRPAHKHEKIKYRFLTFIENNILRGKEIFGYSNWKILK